MFLGLLALMLCLVAAFAGTTVVNYWWSLVLLGIGWNFLFLGGTNMLRGFKGLSLWLSLSHVSLSVLSLLVVRDRGVLDSTRARLARFNAVAMLAFVVLSWLCFINPPRFVPIVGAVAFMLAARGFRLRDAPRFF